jgi:opacity protein-like surface antigen
VISSQQSCTTKIDALGTVTGRFGAAFDHTLYYVLAGFAWDHERLANPANVQTASGPTTDAQFSGTRYGATVGAGIEYALGTDWTAFLQYNYMGFGRRAQVLSDSWGNSAIYRNHSRRHPRDQVGDQLSAQLGVALTSLRT